MGHSRIDYDSNVLSISQITKELNEAEFECTSQNEHGSAQPVGITLNVLCKCQIIINYKVKMSIIWYYCKILIR